MLPSSRRWIVALGGAVVLLIAGGVAYLASRPTPIDGGAAPMTWAECRPEQAEVMVLGTFHFAQYDDYVDVLEPARQEQLGEVLDGLERFGPERIAVEYPRTRSARLDSAYRSYLGRPADSVRSRNEIQQVGFRLARRLGHDRVHPVDVRMKLWHDSIEVFDERWPDARSDLRDRWDVRYRSPDPDELAERPLGEILVAANRDLPPAQGGLYGRFLPLVKGDVYAGALKLRPWYDRNLRIVQNLFRALEPGDGRILLVIGSAHVRVLKQILELTPQLCPVDPVPYLPTSSGGSGPSGT